MNSDQVLQTFISEAHELLEELEGNLLSLTKGAPSDELVNAIFRAAHTIKGSAGLFELQAIVTFTHDLETVLDGVRQSRIALDESLIALMLACGDHLREHMDAVAEGALEPTAELLARGEQLTTQLRGYLDGPTGDAPRPPGLWHLSLRLAPGIFHTGFDPLLLLGCLEQLGQIRHIVTLPALAPPLADSDPEQCFLGFEMAYESSADGLVIDGLFEIVREDCTLTLIAPGSPPSAYVSLVQSHGARPEVIDAIIRCGTIGADALAAALEAPAVASSAAAPPPAGTTHTTATASPSAPPAARAKGGEGATIRVDAEKLDHLINLVGELIIATASTATVGRRAQLAELQECTSTLTTLVQEVRDSALQLRMVKIGGTFSRFQRVVHDVSRELGKDIALEVSGEDTELDKAMVEKLADPLTHLVRNAIDHGIEPPDLRVARGKSAGGTLSLHAYHDSGSIAIEVRDDGGGLRRDKILAKAVERGLVEPGASLSDRDIFNLIFEPGFSTADRVTKLSGRGVGMDVVKRNITSLRGTVDIDSEEGVGTTVTVRIPLTLAIIDGFLVGVGDAIFVVPLDMIEECVEFTAEPGRNYTSLRGEVLPLIRLRQLFGIEGEAARRQNILVIRHGDRSAGLVVDSLLGEFQTVIKPLAKLFNRARCINGSTILGSGEVALILDVPAVLQRAASVGNDLDPTTGAVAWSHV